MVSRSLSTHSLRDWKNNCSSQLQLDVYSEVRLSPIIYITLSTPPRHNSSASARIRPYSHALSISSNHGHKIIKHLAPCFLMILGGSVCVFEFLS